MSELERRMLIVFDIDETLIQYIPSKYNELWLERKEKFEEGSYVEMDKGNGKTDVIIFRPKLEKMMKMFVEDKFYVPALWTYSEREYCEEIAKTIIARYNLPEDFFLFKKGAEDIDEEVGIPKDLTVVYEEYDGKFNKFNTILVDDRYGNINNESNEENGLCIQPFAPFGAEKTREKLSEGDLKKQLKDDVLESVIKIAKAIKKDIEGCEDEDYELGFRTETVFGEKRVKRMGLEKYMQTFAVKFKRVVSIGVPYLTRKFIIIPDYEKYGVKMGGRKRTVKRKNMGKGKGKTNKRR